MYLWPFLQHYMGEIIYFQRCNAPNGPNISSIIVKTYAKLKKSFRLVVLGYTLYFLILGGLSLAQNPGKLKFLIGFLSKSSQYNININVWCELSLAPNPGKLKFSIGFLSKSSQYNINVWYELSFLWKSEPDWSSLSGFWTDVPYDHPSIPALLIHVFWTSYVFLKEYSCGISFSGASSSKQYRFQP